MAIQSVRSLLFGSMLFAVLMLALSVAEVLRPVFSDERLRLFQADARDDSILRHAPHAFGNTPYPT
jgi:hypothetical protein